MTSKELKILQAIEPFTSFIHKQITHPYWQGQVIEVFLKGRPVGFSNGIFKIIVENVNGIWEACVKTCGGPYYRMKNFEEVANLGKNVDELLAVLNEAE